MNISTTPSDRMLDDLAARLCAVERSHPLRVAIDGVDAAGKTTLADRLVGPIERRGRPVLRASIDGFHRPRHQRYARGPLSPEGYFEDSFDLDAVIALLLKPLGPGGDRRVRRAMWDVHADAPIALPEEIAALDSVLLCDGIFLLRPELRPYWDVTVLIEVEREVAIERGIRRDQTMPGSDEIARERYLRRYAPGQQIYRATCRPQDHAHLIIDNTDLDAPRLLTQPPN